jgi:hypothetical protein
MTRSFEFRITGFMVDHWQNCCRGYSLSISGQQALLRKKKIGSSASWLALCPRLIRVRLTSILSPSTPIIENAVWDANSTQHSSKLCNVLAVPPFAVLRRQ